MDPTRWPLARSFPRPHAAMKRLIGLLIATTLETGCAKPDWIDRTLVTVDVTGTWSGYSTGSGSYSGELLFELEQRGSTVKGDMRLGRGNQALGAGEASLTGSAAGDVFRFSTARGGRRPEDSIERED